MRFLQLEWHNHERARNAWDIERAEMKAKIAKQEGEVRSARKLNDQLNKHIRMLEHALMNERAKSKAGGDAQASDDKKEPKGKKSSMKRALNNSHTATLSVREKLTIYSPEQAPQLLPRRRLGIPRPLRCRPRRPPRKVKAIPHQVRRGNYISSDTSAPTSTTAVCYAWTGQRRWLPQPR
jgi:hypothetical protein